MNDVSSACKLFSDLEEATILNYLDELDFTIDSSCDKQLIICDRLLFHFANGDFDKKFDSVYLEGLSDDEKENIKNIVSKYRYLCFKDGNCEYWTDSIMGASLNEPVYISTRILDNYNFLVMLCRDGGENVLKFISKLYGKENNLDVSVIDRLRCNFYEDTILENILLQMSDSDNLFNIFNDSEKRLFLEFPQGVLYEKDDETIKFISPIQLALGIYNKVTGEKYDYNGDVDSFRTSFNKLRGIEEYNDIINTLSIDFLDKKMRKI